MAGIKIGLQLYSLREAFADQPEATLKSIAEMGYAGVELTSTMIPDEEAARFCRGALARTRLSCFGCLTSWSDVQPAAIEETIARNRILGSPFIIIGSVPVAQVATRREAEAAIAYMGEVGDIMSREGFLTGYHNHDTDLFHKLDGKTFFEMVFDNTATDFIMLLDTGNTLAAGYDPVALLNRYPGRSSFLHLKGYSREKGYWAYIGDDDQDWPLLLRSAADTGRTRTASVEFGKRGDYDPFERALTSLQRLEQYLAQEGLS